MTRSIVLRFPSTCFDCGAAIPAGATARWFGKGRVSCCGKGASAPKHSPIPPYLPSASLAQLSTDVGIPVEALASGLSPAHVATLAEKTPNQRLLVRLQSGARFIVPALHAAHVIRCVEESLIDRVRDVALLAGGEA